ITQWIQRTSFRDTEQTDSIASSSPHSRSNVSNTYEAPRNALEQGIAEIWQKLLGVESVGIHDNFFELGGHSLLAIQVFSQLRQTFQVELPLRSMFETPTVAKLAAHLETVQLAVLPRQKGGEAPLSLLVPYHTGGAQPPFFCVHGGVGFTQHLGA